MRIGGNVPDEISISFRCKKCGTALSWPDDIADSTEVLCPGCGESAGTYANLKETATEAAREKVETMLKGMFKRR
jgi:DNA-directed RNA polymerase subunit RPC12/RpoP